MKKVYGKFVDPVLHELFPKSLPDFKPYKVRMRKEDRAVSVLPMGASYYIYEVCGALFVFLAVIRHPRQEDLMVQLFWSNRARFPIDAQLRFEIDPAIALGEGWIDFVSIAPDRVIASWPIWQCSVPPDHPDFMKKFIEEDLAPVPDDVAERRVRAAVSQLISDVQMHAIPFISRLREAYC